MTVGWGVLGASSSIAQRALLPAMAASPNIRLAALASRSGIPDAFGADRTYGSYEQLLADADVEAVYLPLPNHLHAEWTVKAAEAGKHVLCEKPLARTAAEARRMAEACERAGVVLMEAYMTPFHPRSRFIDAVLTSGELGARRGFAAFTFPLDAGNHRWRRDAGGGALLDLGIYCVEPLLLAGGGLPDRITASAIRGGDGVDATFQGRLDFPSGFVGDLLCSFEMPFVQSLTVFGTSASLAADRPFNPKVEETTVTHSERGVITFAAADCYRGLVDHFSAVVRGDAAPSRPPSASVRLLEVLDRLRAAAGLDPAT